ncbi:MAG: S49 family peptidase [Candidatus Krumholzibacteriota bacterium]|nr:S49 family peptidase [Candidatus Krumholzibacteriota bacterium]
MKKGPLLGALLLLSAPASAQLYEHPLAGNDPYLLPFSVAGNDGLDALYHNPAGLAMRPGEWGVLYLQGLRGANDDPALAGEFGSLLTGNWSLAVGGPLAFGVDYGRGVAGFDTDLDSGDQRAIWRGYWRFNLGLGHRLYFPRLDSEVALGAAYRWTRSDAYALTKMGGWDLGLLYRWRRWFSLGFSGRNLNRPLQRATRPGSGGELAPDYVYSLAVRPRLEWATVSLDIHQVEVDRRWEAHPHVGLDLSLRGRLDLRLDRDDEGRISVGLFASRGRWRGLGGLSNQMTASRGTSYGGAGVEWRSRDFGPPLWPRQRFLELRIAGRVPEKAGPGRLGERPPSQTELIALILRARRAGDVAGIYLRLEDPRLGDAQADELREALLDYRRATGRPVVAYSSSYALESYALATAADHLVVDTTGELWLTGLRRERVFLGGALDSLGLEPRFLQYGDRSAALATLTRTEPDFTQRAADSLAVAGRFRQLRDAVADARGIERHRAERHLQQGRFLPDLAIEKGLVDQQRRLDEMPGILAGAGGTDRVLAAADFAARTESKRHWGAAPRIALVTLVGDLVLGHGGYGFLGPRTGTEDAAAALRAARRDRSVAAILLRVDSGGGGALASEAIRREVELTQDRKPVVVSLGNAAAGGAYLAALPGQRLFASPGSRVGGLSVLGGKFLGRDLYGRFGLDVATTTLGSHAGLRGPHSPFSGEERELLRQEMSRRYWLLMEQVSHSRYIADVELDALYGRGSILDGQAAVTAGLADEVGGLGRALDLAREEAGLGRNGPLNLEAFPPPPRSGLVERLRRRLPGRLREAETPAPPAPSVLPRPGESPADWLARLTPFPGEQFLYWEPGLTEPFLTVH